MYHTSYIELSEKAFRNNITYLKKILLNKSRYSMVIKGNAYGHGIETMIPLAEKYGIDHFSVFSVAEANRARKCAGSGCDIMIMGYIGNDEIEWAIQHDVSFYVFTFDRLNAACDVAKRTKKAARLHIEIETGMHRTGFTKSEFERLIRILKKYRGNIDIEGICTHFAGAESINNYTRIRNQIKSFNESVHLMRAAGIVPGYRHTACSAAVLRYPETLMDLVRIGISNYGFWPSDELRMNHFIENEKKGLPPIDPLERVLSWKSEIMSINTVPSGKYISYGKTFLTNRDTKIATVPVGYGYGYSRTLSNQGHVLLHGKRVSVVGSVNMNMLVIDVTDIKKPVIGDEVVLIGNQGDLNISVSSFADMTNSLNYELLARLPAHIPRSIVA